MSVERNAAIGKNIALLIRENGKHQKDVAKDLGISESALSGYVKGKTAVPAWIVADIADYFHVSPERLLSNPPVEAGDTSFPLGYFKDISNYTPKALFDCLDILLTCFLGNFELVEQTRTVPVFSNGTIRKQNEKMLSILIRDDTIQWLLQRWELYLQTVDSAIDSLDELKGALINDFVSNVLYSKGDYLRLQGGHIVSKFNAAVYANNTNPDRLKLGKRFFDLVEVDQLNKVFFLEDYKDEAGAEIGKENRKLEFAFWSNWKLEDVDKEREKLLKYHSFIKARNEKE